jgi:hypothetical protein
MASEGEASSRTDEKLTARQEVLLAAAEISDFKAGVEFTEWDLTVKAWKLNPGRWGLPGYESTYPDHKRVMNELMAAGTERIVGRGWLERSSTNHYRLTASGLAQALSIRSTRRSSTKRDYALYDAVEPLAFHRVFATYLSDQSEPKIWLGAAAFLGLSKSDPEFFERKLSSVKTIITDTIEFMRTENIEQLRRGDSGRALTLDRVLRLSEFVTLLEERFAPQIAAIRGRARSRVG